MDLLLKKQGERTEGALKSSASKNEFTNDVPEMFEEDLFAEELVVEGGERVPRQPDCLQLLNSRE